MEEALMCKRRYNLKNALGLGGFATVTGLAFFSTSMANVFTSEVEILPLKEANWAGCL